jgi:hypothetical protein
VSEQSALAGRINVYLSRLESKVASSSTAWRNVISISVILPKIVDRLVFAWTGFVGNNDLVRLI